MDAQNLKGASPGNRLHKLPCQRDAVSMKHGQAIQAFISSMPMVMQTLRSTSSRRLGSANIEGMGGILMGEYAIWK